MLLFGHIGITLGAAALLSNTLPKRRFSRATAKKVTESVSPVAPKPNSLPSSEASWFSALGSRIDIRLLMVGSLLPDIIDKPLGQLFFRETLSNGRIFSHTLLFLILITLAGLYRYKSYGRTSLLALSFGTFTHLILDQMWRNPRTLFWPIYGFTFDRIDLADWLPHILRALKTDPQVYLPELVGIAILVWFTLVLMRKQKVIYFLKYGRMQ